MRDRGFGREGQREREKNRYLIPDINIKQSILPLWRNSISGNQELLISPLTFSVYQQPGNRITSLIPLPVLLFVQPMHDLFWYIDMKPLEKRCTRRSEQTGLLNSNTRVV